MSEVLACIRVREMHGIRRFLYPLTVEITLPYDRDIFWIGMETSMGVAIPLLVSFAIGIDDQPLRVYFAVSLDPLASEDLNLVYGQEPKLINDPLQVELIGEGYRSKQHQFDLASDWNANIISVNYGGVPHLRGSSSLTRNGAELERQDYRNIYGNDLISAWFSAIGEYVDTNATTTTQITACKSWATLTHTLEQPKPNDEIVFTLPLVITSPTLTCDFGVGGYVFGKLDANAPEIVWRTEFGDAPYAKWSVATAGRVDYLGTVDSDEAFLPQRWFHLIDSDKALAVAITKLPEDCSEMTVRLTLQGDVIITFRLGENITGPADFGVCYHFLNDVPAIAAATNPQSILLPPVVEVLNP